MPLCAFRAYVIGLGREVGNFCQGQRKKYILTSVNICCNVVV